MRPFVDCCKLVGKNPKSVGKPDGPEIKTGMRTSEACMPVIQKKWRVIHIKWRVMTLFSGPVKKTPLIIPANCV